MTNTMKQKGQIAIMMAVSIIVLIGVVGLAIDSGLGYIVKAKLNAAVDAAAIAGGRALSQGDTQANQRLYATQAAQKFFHANYPAGYMGSTPSDPAITVSFIPPPNCTPPRCGTVIDVSATATLPVNFMQVLNFSLLNVAASATAVRQNVDLAFVVDITGSLSGVANSVRDRAQAFLDHLDSSSDRVALISYQRGAQVNDAIRTVTRGFNRSTMQSHIANLDFEGNTNSAEGFWQARNQLNSVPTTPLGNRSNLRVIVFFTDGAPNTFASTFPVRRMSTPDPVCGGSNHTCNCSNRSTSAGFCNSPSSRACTCTCTGSLQTGDGSSGTPTGLYWHETTNGNQVSGTCYRSESAGIISSGTNDPGIYQLPAWYKAPHGGVVPPDEFMIAPQPSGPPQAPPQLRNITTTPSYANINRASRNLAEEMAWVARNEGIYVFVLGLGDLLHHAAGPDNEIGERLLKCMANTNDGGDPSITPLSRCHTYNQNNGLNQPAGNQTIGTYCWAHDDASLATCYDKLASQILRLAL
jgi:Flp pilus assembly protein TadG